MAKGIKDKEWPAVLLSCHKERFVSTLHHAMVFRAVKVVTGDQLLGDTKQSSAAKLSMIFDGFGGETLGSSSSSISSSSDCNSSGKKEGSSGHGGSRGGGVSGGGNELLVIDSLEDILEYEYVQDTSTSTSDTTGTSDAVSQAFTHQWGLNKAMMTAIADTASRQVMNPSVLGTLQGGLSMTAAATGISRMPISSAGTAAVIGGGTAAVTGGGAAATAGTAAATTGAAAGTVGAGGAVAGTAATAGTVAATATAGAGAALTTPAWAPVAFAVGVASLVGMGIAVASSGTSMTGLFANTGVTEALTQSTSHTTGGSFARSSTTSHGTTTSTSHTQGTSQSTRAVLGTTSVAKLHVLRKLLDRVHRSSHDPENAPMVVVFFRRATVFEAIVQALAWPANGVAPEMTSPCPRTARFLLLRMDCCGKFWCCQVCHDECSQSQECSRPATAPTNISTPGNAGATTAVSRRVTTIQCLRCQKVQSASGECIECRKRFARFTCLRCRKWEGYPRFIHCDGCQRCIRVTESERHGQRCPGPLVPLESA